MLIRGKTFVVTGGGSGLGAAAARMLADEGANVVIADINADAGARIVGELGTGAAFILTDVTQDKDGQAAIDMALEHFGHLHGLINCAGVAPGEKVIGRDGPHRLDSFARTIAINLVGTFNMIRLAADAIAREAPDAAGARGVIVNTASIAAFDGQKGQAAYAASKAGIAGMTLPLARDLAAQGIRVCAIAPGIFATPMMGGLPQEVQDGLAAEVTFPRRLGEPEEFARLVAFIIRSGYLNGEVIRLDGALRMR